MPARRGAFDHEAVDRAVGALEERRREHVRRDDGEEGRPPERRQRREKVHPRIERHDRRRVVGVSGQRERIACRFVAGQTVEDAWHAERNAGAHQHVVDTGQHGAVEGGEVWDLDLLEIVDADRIRMALARQQDLDEVGDDAELHQFRRVGDVLQRQRLERLRGTLSARHEVGAPDAVGHRTEWKLIERATHVAARVPHLEAAGQDRVERGPGHDAELSLRRHGAGEAPVGDAGAHPSLDDEGPPIRVVVHYLPPSDPRKRASPS